MKGHSSRGVRGAFTLIEVLVVVAFCYQGEHMEYVYSQSGHRGEARKQDPRWNPRSHPINGGGGSPAIFADGHVEWVRGPRIGWP